MLPKNKYFLLNLYHILNDGFFDAIPVLLTFVVFAYGLGEKEIGIVISSGTALSTVAGLATIYFSNHLSPLKILSLVIAMGGAGFLAAAFSPNFIFTGLSFTIIMFGYSIFHNICFSYITIHTERNKLGRVLSDFTALGDIGRIPFIAIAGYASAFTIANIAGWKFVCFSFGLIGIVSAIMLLRFSKNDKLAQNEHRSHQSGIPSFTILRNKAVFLSLAASVLNAFSNEKIFTFLPAFLLAKGFDPAIIGTFAVGFTIGSFLGKIACGRLLDKFGAKSVFIVAESLLSVFLFLIIYSNSLLFIMTIAFIIGLLTKGTVPIIQAIITIPFQNIGRYDEIFSINSFLRGITNILSPLFFGFIASFWSINIIYVIMGIISLITCLIKLFDLFLQEDWPTGLLKGKSFNNSIT